jgi:hypothetical protein
MAADDGQRPHAVAADPGPDVRPSASELSVVHGQGQPEPGWPAALRDGRQGLRYLYCLLNSQQWVHRRVDTLTFNGLAHVSQRTSLDLSIPFKPPVYRLLDGEEYVVLPSAQVGKDPLIDFDIQDSDGVHLPLLTDRQNCTITVLGILHLAAETLEKNSLGPHLTQDFSAAGGDRAFSINKDRSTYLELPSYAPTPDGQGESSTALECAEVQEVIVRMITGTAEDGRRGVLDFERAQAGTLRGVLWGQLTLRIYLRRLAENAYMAAAMPIRSPHRRVINYSLERRRAPGHLRIGGSLLGREIRDLVRAVLWRDVAGRCGHFGRTTLERLGLIPLSVLTDVSAAQDCASYHLEVDTPRGLKITDLHWFICPPGGREGTPAGLNHGERRIRAADEREQMRKRIVAELGEDPIRVTPDVRRGHEHDRIHTTIADVPLGYNLSCRLRMAPVAGGWLLLAVPTTLMAVGLIVLVLGSQGTAADNPLTALPWIGHRLNAWATSLRLHDEAANDETAGALLQNRMTLLLGVFVLAGTVLLNSGENPLPRRLLLFPRLATFCVLLTLLVCSSFLVVVPNSVPGHAAGVGVATGLALASMVSALAVICAELVAIGVVRTSVRRLRRMIGKPDDQYWKVWSA